MRSTALLFLIPAALLLSSSRASASRQPTKKAKERLAKKACLAGDPAKGVEILAELYVDTNILTYIFNQGRCFEQNRRYEDAIGRFREYLLKGEATLSDEDKAVAQKRIEACESYLPKPEPPSPLVPEPVQVAPVVQAPPAATPPAEVVPETPVVAVVAQPRQPGSNAGARLRIAGLVAGSLGVVALGTGVALNLKANSMAADLGKPDNFNRDTDSSRKSYKTLSWIGYGVGAGLLAGGTLMYYLGWRSGRRSTSTVVLVPTFAPDSAGALLAGAF
ncbi:MAG: hypothetical protein JXP73_03900 [Deltaproteobacteria bacterium]|nr:hypothetical protein [Deltaproteobacteria bacterium]